MTLLENISLKPYHTFGMDINARCFVEIFYEDELIGFLEEK